MTIKLNSIFEPALLADLTALAKLCQSGQTQVDGHKWSLAKRVNSEWPEYVYMFPAKLDYYAAMSEEINRGLPISLFGSSGQTMRRWCEVQATYTNFPEAMEFLSATSFDHMAKAKKLAHDGKVSVPVLALAEAVSRKWSADDMQEHYDPPTAPTEYDIIDSSLMHMLNPKNWEWIKSAHVKDTIISHVRAIDTIRREYLESEKKAI